MLNMHMKVLLAFKQLQGSVHFLFIYTYNERIGYFDLTAHLFIYASIRCQIGLLCRR